MSADACMQLMLMLRPAGGWTRVIEHVTILHSAIGAPAGTKANITVKFVATINFEHSGPCYP